LILLVAILLLEPFFIVNLTNSVIMHVLLIYIFKFDILTFSSGRDLDGWRAGKCEQGSASG